MEDKYVALDKAWLKGFRWIATSKVGDCYQRPKEKADLLFSPKEKALKKAFIDGATTALDSIGIKTSDHFIITEVYPL